MALELAARQVGDVTVLKCSGRLVAGTECESLHAMVQKLLPEHKRIVLELADVKFIDSSGLGMLVRLLGSTRSARADIKLCNVCKEVAHSLKLTNLVGLFETHASEAEAVSAFYRRPEAAESIVRSGSAVLCLDESADVLAYLRELLRRAGYDPLTTRNPSDAKILLTAAKPAVVILGPSVAGGSGDGGGFARSLGSVPVVHLPGGFSTAEAGAAALEVLEQVKMKLAAAGSSIGG